MTSGQIIITLAYILDVTLCLLAIRKKNSHGYAVTKSLLMPALCLVYFAFLPERLLNVNHQYFILLALAAHTLGDMLLLLPRGKRNLGFYLGMLAFLAGHIMYILWFAKADVTHSKRWSVIAFVVVFILEYFLYRQLMLGPRKYAPRFIPYSLGLAFLFVAAAGTMGTGVHVLATVMAMTGVGLFIFSDYNIMRRTVRLPLFGQMVVMTTYIAGQTLIVLGALLLQL